MKPLAMHVEEVRTRDRVEMIDITSRIRGLIEKAQLKDGIVVVHVPHTTAAVTVNENADPDVQHDLIGKLARMIPQNESFYRHGEGNSDSHLKSSLVGCSQTLIVEGGKLMLGTWQGVYFCEFDGPRRREVWVKLVSTS